MSHRKPRRGDGTAWLVADTEHDDFLCYWYAGPNDVRLVEQSRVPSAAQAVAWGRLRTDRVRIRTADARTSWVGAGTGGSSC